MSHAVVLVTFPTEPDDNMIDEVMLPYHEYESTGIEKYIEEVDITDDVMREFEEYKETGNADVRKQLQEKLRNNRVTDDNFCRDTDMDVVLESLDEKEETVEKEIEQKVSIEDLDEIYEEVTGKERQEEAGKIRGIYSQIKSIKRENSSEER